MCLVVPNYQLSRGPLSPFFLSIITKNQIQRRFEGYVADSLRRQLTQIL